MTTEKIGLAKFCQDCKHHKNRPGTCTLKHVWMARKELSCDSFKVKKGKK